MIHYNTTLEDIYTQLVAEIDRRQEELDAFSAVINEHLDCDDTRPEALFDLASYLFNPGDGHDHMALSLFRHAALLGHKKSQEIYEENSGDKLAIAA